MGRHAVPHSYAAEDGLASTSTPRHKARYADSPRHFDSFETAVRIASRRAVRLGRRQRVMLDAELRGSTRWIVRHAA